MTSPRLLLGWSMVLFPLAVQVPFTLLTLHFSYPDILLRPVAEVLTRFHAGGAPLVGTWYVYALCTPGLAVVAVLLPQVLEARGAAARLSVVAGVVAALAQFLGLLRWVFVVPVLASQWVTDPASRDAVAVAYEVQHRLFGALVGEHVGQFAMGAWTLLAAALLAQAGRPRWVVALGAVAGALFVLGLGAGLARVLPVPAWLQQVPLVAFVVWSVWCVATGVLTLRRTASTAT